MAAPAALITAAIKSRAASQALRWAIVAALALVAVALGTVVLVVALFAGTPQAQCRALGASATGGAPAGPSAGQRGMFDQPLRLQPGRSYRTGATWFEDGDGSGTGTTGAIPLPGQSDLTQHPDSFAELSLKTVNEGITFQTANALGSLPWLTGLRVSYQGRSVVVYKRDIGFGQGAETIDGERYRLDLWGPEARALGTTSSVVQVRLAPKTGAGNTLGDTPDPDSGAPAECPVTTGTGGPLPLTSGPRAKLLPNGQAAAPADAPAQVKKIIAAGNEIVGKPYLLGGGHGLPLNQISSTYDCSSSVSHLLYGAGLVDVGYTPASGDMAASYGQPGYGKLVSVLANSDHVYMYVDGLRWDTHRYTSTDRGVAGIGWHTAQRPDTGFTPRHPEGL